MYQFGATIISYHILFVFSMHIKAGSSNSNTPLPV